MTATRIYVVTQKKSGVYQLIRAANQAQAIRHAARKEFIAEVASQDQLVVLVASGVKVEDSSEMLADQVIEHVAGLVEVQDAAH